MFSVVVQYLFSIFPGHVWHAFACTFWISILILVIPGLFAVNLNFYDPLLPMGFEGLMKAMPMLFFSYAGFETLSQVAGETKDPTKTLPMIFVRGVSISVVIFFSLPRSLFQYHRPKVRPEPLVLLRHCPLTH